MTTRSSITLYATSSVSAHDAARGAAHGRGGGVAQGREHRVRERLAAVRALPSLPGSRSSSVQGFLGRFFGIGSPGAAVDGWG